MENEEENETMLEKMKEMIAEQLNVDAEAVLAESSFKEDLGADSLDLFELVMALEDEYSVEIPSEDLEKLTTVSAVMDYLKAKNGLGCGTSSGGGCIGSWRAGTDRRCKRTGRGGQRGDPQGKSADKETNRSQCHAAEPSCR